MIWERRDRKRRRGFLPPNNKVMRREGFMVIWTSWDGLLQGIRYTSWRDPLTLAYHCRLQLDRGIHVGSREAVDDRTTSRLNLDKSWADHPAVFCSTARRCMILMGQRSRLPLDNFIGLSVSQINSSPTSRPDTPPTPTPTARLLFRYSEDSSPFIRWKMSPDQGLRKISIPTCVCLLRPVCSLWWKHAQMLFEDMPVKNVVSWTGSLVRIMVTRGWKRRLTRSEACWICVWGQIVSL